ncbi:hypothetical protein GCM10023084_16640 [Streptomyces lacrimifluminis]|uniref:Uncharacterized protein n=1 Tax=Streptomyces lacrimifluminis TaxID=1500077 RepID=A0A917KDL6_9ACTN|nr:hypothetical protein GCM10012282_01010 [Streptomyces lacrimifluminis]
MNWGMASHLLSLIRSHVLLRTVRLLSILCPNRRPGDSTRGHRRRLLAHGEQLAARTRYSSPISAQAAAYSGVQMSWTV